MSGYLRAGERWHPTTMHHYQISLVHAKDSATKKGAVLAYRNAKKKKKKWLKQVASAQQCHSRSHWAHTSHTVTKAQRTAEGQWRSFIFQNDVLHQDFRRCFSQQKAENMIACLSSPSHFIFQRGKRTNAKWHHLSSTPPKTLPEYLVIEKEAWPINC